MACLNCAKNLNNEGFCPDCGQKNKDNDISLKVLLGDFFKDYFSFDSKLFNTLIPLFTKPGLVPLEFIEGKRVKHIPPLRSLIFTSFVFFLFFSSSVLNNMDQDLETMGQIEGSMDIDIGNGLVDINVGESDSLQTNTPLHKLQAINKLIKEGATPRAAVDSIAAENNYLQKRFYLQWAKMKAASAQLFTKFVVGNLSIMVLVLQPLLALLFWLLFVRHRKTYNYVRHLVFVLYTHSWILILATLFVLLSKWIPSAYLRGLGLVGILVYVLFSLKRFYGQSWGKTVIKTLAASIIYTVVIFPILFIISISLSFLFF